MFRSNGNFDKLLEKATSNLRLDPDWPSILEICDLIRQNDCSPKYAVAAIKKKLTSTNPHQAMFALLVLESIVKNCGSGVHDEIASVANCESYRSLVKAQTHENVRTKILELMQAWAYAFRNIPKYRSVQDAVNILKAEGYKFPTLKESDAMFSADSAPEWSDGDVCHRCRVQFTLMQRKHHCRACGQVFCQQCSAKTTTLPKFGIEKEVRVCDACLEQVKKPVSSGAPTKSESTELSTAYTNSTAAQESHAPKSKTAEELREEEELQLAIALSQSEAEHKEKERRAPTISHTVPDISTFSDHSHGSPPNSASPAELSRYLDRNLWEKLAQSNASQSEPPSAPTPSPGPAPPSMDGMTNKMNALKLENGSSNPEMEEFVATLKSQVEIFVNRMKSNSSRGRSIANDSSVQTLFMNITAMHSRLLRYIQQHDDNRVHYEGLQDKLAQVKDSRAALDVLREEHAERVRRAAEQAEIQRQLQMAHKLDVMRKKKQEYLQYQRQLALQRVQEQEREMQMRQEQQKHQYMLGGTPFYMQGSPVHQYQGNQPPPPGYGQMYQPMMPGMHQQGQGPPQGQPNNLPPSNIALQPGQQHPGQLPQLNMQLPGMAQMPPGIGNPLRQVGPGMPHINQPGQIPHLNQQQVSQHQPQSQINKQIPTQNMQGPQSMQPTQHLGQQVSSQMNMQTGQPMHQPSHPGPGGPQINSQIGQLPHMGPHSQTVPPHQAPPQGGQINQTAPPMNHQMGQQGYHMMQPKGVQMMYMDPQMNPQLGQMGQGGQVPPHMLMGQAGQVPHMAQINGPMGPVNQNSPSQPVSHPPNQMVQNVQQNMQQPSQNINTNQMNPPNQTVNADIKVGEPIINRSPTGVGPANNIGNQQVTSSPTHVPKAPPQQTVNPPEEISTAELICFD